MLVLISGLPGVGKSTLAERLAPRLEAVVLSRDWARAEVVVVGGPGVRLAEYLASRLFRRHLRQTQERASRVLEAVVERDISYGIPVIVEVVADLEIRRRLESLTVRHRIPFFQIECVCPDRSQHLRRLDARARSWRRTLARAETSYHSPNPADCLVVQTTDPIDEVVASVCAHLDAA
jgi:predicted kinase